MTPNFFTISLSDMRLTRVYTHKKACKGTKKNANTQIFTAKVNTYLSFLHSLHIDTLSQTENH